MKIRVFTSELWLPLPPEKLFPFFADAANLETITPPWLNFKILTTMPITMGEGTMIDYKLRIRGVPVRWRTRINLWEPPYRFVDEQIRGPYRQWLHEHTFKPSSNGALCCDTVRYAVPMDFLIHHRFVRPDIEQIFKFRAEALQRRFAVNQKPLGQRQDRTPEWRPQTGAAAPNDSLGPGPSQSSRR